MAETQTKSTQSQDTDKAQEKRRRLEPVPQHVKALADESVPFPGLLGDVAINPLVERHAVFLGDPRFAHSANSAQKARMLTELQGTYGNAYVQRVVAQATTVTPSVPTQEKRDEELSDGELASDIAQRIARQRGSGMPLDPEVRSQMEASFGHDFRQVRIHTDSEANRLSQELGANAFTTGKDVFFKGAAYQPGSENGARLIAHELTHVIQQTGSMRLQRQVSKELPAAPPAKTAAQSPEEAMATAEAEGPEVTAEAIEPLPEVICVSEDSAPEESQAAEASVAAASAGLVPTPVPCQILPPDHPAEREAEAVSQSIMSAAEKGNRPRIGCGSSGVLRMIQRQVYWEDRNTVNWADFKANAPRGAKRAAAIYSGFRSAAPNILREAHPYPPIIPETCKIGKKTATKFSASVGIDLMTLNVRGYMLPAKSWVKPGRESADLLAHEQGHFDIANVIAEKVENAIMFWNIKQDTYSIACGEKAALNAATKKWNAAKPNKAAKQINDGGKALLHRVNSSTGDYDTETNHGTKAAEQKAWQGKIAAGLPDYVVPVPVP